jgi:hypothetical protein
MPDEIVHVRKLSQSAWPPGPRIPWLRSALRLAFETGHVLADPDPEPPPVPDKVAHPKGVGARPAGTRRF